MLDQVSSPIPELGLWLTPDAAAKKLCVSRSLIYKLIQTGRLPARRIGDKLLRINERELNALSLDGK
jgi:excisionase family DNA binding protein